MPSIEHALEPIIDIAYVFNKSKLPSAYKHSGGLLIFFKFSGKYFEL